MSSALSATAPVSRQRSRLRRLAPSLSIALLTVIAGCSGESAPRPQASVGNSDVIVPEAPVASAAPINAPVVEAPVMQAPQEERVVGLAEEEENHVAQSTPQSQPQYSGDYGFTAPVQNPVTAAENIYTMSNSEAACRTRLKRLGVVFGKAADLSQQLLPDRKSDRGIRFQQRVHRFQTGSDAELSGDRSICPLDQG